MAFPPELILVWGWLAIYLAAFFLSPLTSGPLAARRRAAPRALVAALLLGDEIVRPLVRRRSVSLRWPSAG